MASKQLFSLVLDTDALVEIAYISAWYQFIKKMRFFDVVVEVTRGDHRPLGFIDFDVKGHMIRFPLVKRNLAKHTRYQE